LDAPGVFEDAYHNTVGQFERATAGLAIALEAGLDGNA
jgi:hypothetical protein